MLSIKPLNNAENTAAYFFELEKYYVKDGVADNSRWFGKGAAEFDLRGHVDRQTFSKFLHGELPNGQLLGRIRNEKREHRPGIDLTFSAPKSVSLLAYVLGYERVVEDHETSVTQTLEFVQDQFAQARMKLDKFKKEIDFVNTQHLTAALFQHPTSRALDPQLHTHAIVMNMTQCPDGKYRSLSRGPVGQTIDAHAKGFLERLFHNQRTVGAIYRGFLAHELFKRGADIHMTHKDARFEVRGVSESLMKTFSKRRTEIESLLHEKGWQSARAASIATVATNRAKSMSDLDKLKERWRSQCTIKDFQKDYFSHTKHEHTQPVFDGLCIEHAVSHTRYTYEYAPTLCDNVLTHATADLNEREASFTWQELIVRSIYYAKGHLSPADLMQSIERWHEKEKLIGSTDIQGREARLTTPAALGLENDTIFWMQRGQDVGQVIPLYDPPAFKRHCAHVLRVKAVSTETSGQVDASKKATPDSQQATPGDASGVTLNAGQHDALRLIATTDHRIIGIQGNPGVGKTTLLRAAREMINPLGHPIIGLAASADAAKTLTQETQISALTIARFLTEHRQVGLKAHTQRSKRTKTREEPVDTTDTTVKPIEKHSVIIVDEASLVSTVEMNQLIRFSHDQDARLVLVGDFNQFGAIQHGKPFYELIRTGMQTAYVTEILRQRNPLLKEAVYQAVRHHLKDSIQTLGENIHCIDKADERLQAIADAYLALSDKERDHTRVATPTRAERDTLNHLIRAGLKLQGHFQGKEVRTPIYQAKDLTLADKTLARSFEPGNIVRFNRFYRRLNIDTGDYLTVLRTDEKTNTVILEHALGALVTWRPHKVAGRQPGAVEVFEKKERSLAAGDLIRWTRNDARSGKCNGQLARVSSVNLLGAKLTWLDGAASSNQSNQPKTSRIWFARSKDAHWDHAYAWTTRSLQGHNCDGMLINQPAESGRLTNERSFLGGISRARYRVTVFTNDKQALIQLLEKHSGQKSSAIEVLYAANTSPNRSHTVQDQKQSNTTINAKAKETDMSL